MHYHIQLPSHLAMLVACLCAEQEQEIEASKHFGNFIDTRSVASRVSQHNGFGLLLLSFIMFLWLLYWNTIGWLLPVMRQYVESKEMKAQAEGELRLHGCSCGCGCLYGCACMSGQILTHGTALRALSAQVCYT